MKMAKMLLYQRFRDADPRKKH